VSLRIVSELGAWRLLRAGDRYRRLGERLDGSDVILDEATGETFGIAAPGWPLRVVPVGPILRAASAAREEAQRGLAERLGGLLGEEVPDAGQVDALGAGEEGDEALREPA